MIDNSWVLDRQTTIYSRVKAQVLAELKKSYPDLTVTQDDKAKVDAKFPNVYITFLQPIEQGKDLTGKEINAVMLTVQVDVKVTNEQGMLVADNVSWTVLKIFKEMGFDASMPSYETSTSETYRTIARYSRVIGYSDII